MSRPPARENSAESAGGEGRLPADSPLDGTSSDSPAEVRLLAERLTDLEMLYTHLQQDCETLNATILQQGEVITTLKLAVRELEDRLHQLTGDRSLPDAATERPPQY